jgi:hypothetical protein
MAKPGPAKDALLAKAAKERKSVKESAKESAKQSENDPLDEVLDESFPASDPPSWTLGNGTAAARDKGNAAQLDADGRESDEHEADDTASPDTRSADEPQHPLRIRDPQRPTAGR